MVTLNPHCGQWGGHRRRSLELSTLCAAPPGLDHKAQMAHTEQSKRSHCATTLVALQDGDPSNIEMQHTSGPYYFLLYKSLRNEHECARSGRAHSHLRIAT